MLAFNPVTLCRYDIANISVLIAWLVHCKRTVGGDIQPVAGRAGDTVPVSRKAVSGNIGRWLSYQRSCGNLAVGVIVGVAVVGVSDKAGASGWAKAKGIA